MSTKPTTIPSPKLATHIGRSVRGQDAAIADITAAVARGRCRLLLIGPPATGKTTAAVAIAETFGGALRLDGAAFKDVATSRARLADAIAARGRRTIVLDEAEKANPEAISGIAAMLDADRTMGCVVTTNWNHADAVRIADGVTCAAQRDAALRRLLAERYTPTLIDALDAVIVFLPLDAATVRDLVVEHARSTAYARRFTVASISPAAIRHLVGTPYGVREALFAAQRSLYPAAAGDVVRLVMRSGAVGIAVVGRMPVRRTPPRP